jgi:hypothetical protein
MNSDLGRLGTIFLILGVIGVGTVGATVSGGSRHVVAIDPKVAGLVKQPALKRSSINMMQRSGI